MINVDKKERQKQYRKEHSKEIYTLQLIWNKKHPEKIKQYGRKYYQTHKEYFRIKTQKYLRKLKQKFIDMLGGKCVGCGYDKFIGALEFHHIYPEEKESKYEYYRKDFEQKIKDGKIQLLCANCHRETHYGKNTQISGTLSASSIILIFE